MISPPVGGTQRDQPDRRHRINAVRFSIASVCAAAALGVIVSVLGRSTVARWPAATQVSIVILAIVSSVYALSDIADRPIPVPSRHWLVPRDWAAFGSSSFSTLFGVFLGLGIFTIVPFIGFYVVLAGCALLLDPIESAGVLAAFGAMRGLPVILAEMAVRSEDRFAREAALGIVSGHAAADQSLIRTLRIASLVLTSAMLFGHLI